MTFYYKPQTQTVTTYRRCYRIEGANVYNEVPALSFREEIITLGQGDKLIAKVPEGPPLTALMNNPDQVITLINPDTGLPIPGKAMKFSDIYLGLYSLYFALAQARDQASP